MPGEKRKVSDEIVKVIETRVNDYVTQIDHGQSEQLEEAMAKYQTSIEQFYQEKFNRLSEKQTGLENKEISALRFEMNSELKRYRDHLLNEFKASLEEDIKAFVSDRKSYETYLEHCLKRLEKGGIVYVNQDDISLIKDFKTEVRALELGGLVYELGNRVYDYSLKSRFDNAMQKFVETSQIWIRSDEN